MLRVLVVDDKEENLYYLRALLVGHGYDVEEARHGAEALVKARQRTPDLVISDLLMPVMDGYTLLRHWRADAALRHRPFIVYTATYTEAEDERLAYSLGADAFILKPAEPEDFMERIREVQSRPNGEERAATGTPAGDEAAVLKVYSETLIRKLEERTLQLEESNQLLQRDVAERKAIEAALRASIDDLKKAEARIGEQASLLDKTRDAIIVRTLDHRITFVNRGAERIYGWPAAEAVGQSVLDLLKPELAVFVSAMRDVLREGEWAGELQKSTREGVTLTMDCRWTLVRGEEGAPDTVLAVETDVTERTQLQQQFLRAQRLESIGTLAGGIAHDLNNALAPIMLSLELLRLASTDADRRDLIATIESSAVRGAAMVRQVLSFARGVEGRRLPVQLGHLIRDVEKIANDTFLKNVTIRTSIPSTLRSVIGDPTQLHQVLLNLCVNARDAMPDGGVLTLDVDDGMLDDAEAQRHDGACAGLYVVVRVSDTGTGMTSNVRDRIFEPFFTTKDVGRGTGLGLSTSLAIVRSHGGFIEVDSVPSGGTTFRVWLPAAAAQKLEPPRPDAVVLPRGSGELVLVVDDEEASRQMTSRALVAFDYRALVAKDGVEALAQITAHRDEVAAVITDMMMPIMDGRSLIEALGTLAPELPVIATSGLHLDESLDQPGGQSTRHFLTKPYSMSALLRTLERVLCRGGTQRQAPSDQ